MQKMLITGSSGFIGQHLIERLQHSFEIKCLKSDLRNYEDVLNEVLASEADIVIHLAARTEVEQSFYEQTTFSEINYTGTVNLIESILKCKKIARLIFASTMEVYGWQPESDNIQQGNIPNPIPVFDENITVPHPNAPYAVAKYGCEKYIEYAHRALGLQYVIIRQTNSYGRKDNNFFVTEQTISQMLTSNICKLGYQNTLRNFLFITDLLDAWETVITQFDSCANQIFNLGPSNAIKIEDYANMIADKIRWHGTIVWDSKPKRPGEIWLLNSSEDKLKKITGWYPKVSLSDGLDQTIEIWRKKLC